MASTTVSTNTATIVEKFRNAWESGDFKTARALLRDDLSFQGPLDTFNQADDFVTAVQKLGEIVKGVRDRTTLVEGNQAAVFYTLDTVLGASPVAEWYTIRGDRIASIRAYFDARPFAPAPGK